MRDRMTNDARLQSSVAVVLTIIASAVLTKDRTLIAGKVKFYNSEGRFGYIQQDRSTDQFRVLGSALTRAGIKRLSEGQRVNFDTHTDPDSGRTVVDKLEIA